MRTSAETVRLREDLLALVRKRVPSSDAEDVVQSTLMEALAAKSAPQEHEPFRKFAFGVARNKIADYYRRSKRETLEEAPEIIAAPENHENKSLLDWANDRLPNSESKKTFDWMLREGDGEKLENIAEDESVPAPRVRKRVSRLREHLRTHWKQEVALLAAMGIAGVVLFMWLGKREPEMVQPVVPDVATPEKLATPYRLKAHEACDAQRFQECLENLDRARAIDPTGDALPGAAADRARANDALHPQAPVPAPPGPLNNDPKMKMSDDSASTPTAVPRVAPKSAPPGPAKPGPAKSGPAKPQTPAPSTPSKASSMNDLSSEDGPLANTVSRNATPAKSALPVGKEDFTPTPQAAVPQQAAQQPFVQKPAGDVPAQMGPKRKK